MHLSDGQDNLQSFSLAVLAIRFCPKRLIQKTFPLQKCSKPMLWAAVPLAVIKEMRMGPRRATRKEQNWFLALSSIMTIYYQQKCGYSNRQIALWEWRFPKGFYFFENFFVFQVSFLAFRVAMGGCEVNPHFRTWSLKTEYPFAKTSILRPSQAVGYATTPPCGGERENLLQI